MVEVEKSMLLMVNGKGYRRARRYAAQLEKEAKNRGFSVELHITESVEAAEKILSGDLSRFGVVAKVGGDGTGKVILDALQKKDEKPLYVDFGGGSTDVLRKAIGMPRFNAEKAIQAVEEGYAYRSDLIQVTVNDQDSFFISNVSLGTVAGVFEGERFLGIGGLVGYLPQVPRVIAHAEHLGAEIVIDDDEKNKLILERTTDFFIHNGGDLGNFSINPTNMYDNSSMHVLIFNGKSDRPSVNAVRSIVGALAKKPLGEDQKKEAKKKVEVRLKRRTKWQREGDYEGEIPAEETIVFQRVPDAIGIVAPNQQMLQYRGFQGQGEEIFWRKPTPSTAR